HASGVLIIEGAQNNTVGDRSNSNLKNIVAFNAGDGVLLRDNNTTGNTVRFNSIFSNGGLGINLVGGNEDNNGVTANDAKDGDTGPNNLQNYPVITSTSTSGGSAIFGSLNSTPNTTVAIDIYFNSVADPAGYGEGQTFEGSQNVITDANGNATFNISTTNVTGFYPVAMATNLTTGDSSEFGPALADNIVTNTNDSGTGSLRNAINFANSNPGTTIRFGIPITDGGYNATTGAFTIQPATPLPTIIKDGTIIDGTTQGASFGDTNANGPEIVIDGTSAGAGAKGLTITAANCVVRGLTIDNFTGSLSSGQSPDKDAAAIYIFGGNNNRVEGCYIGTDATGTAAASAQAINGIVLENNGIAQARFNTIGGSTTAGAGNLISGNANIGVLCFTGTNGNSIVGNLIGTDRTGTTRVLNGEGVRLDGSHDNSIGGQTAEAQNVISGNGSSGIFIVHSGADSNVIQGNIIGLDINGANAINSGGGTGISVLQGPVNNRIGGTAVGAGNTISGNFFGVFISDAATGGTVIEGNLIGTDINGTLAKGNAYGVYLSNTANTTTIGIDEGGSNVIAGNTNDGIQISNSSGVTVQSNLIGVDSSGSVALANAGSGVSITGTSSGNFIGVPGGGNVISGNKQQDVLLSGSDVAGNLVQGNLIGTNAQDTAAIPSLIGVVLDSGAHDNTVGGTAQNAGNVISGHTTPPTVAGHFDNGININGANNNTVQGNFIGTNRSGSTAIKNSNIGIHIFGGSTGNLIGGTASGAGNVISGNANRGLTITDLGTTGNTVQGNIVGLDSTATTALHYDNTNGTPSNGVGLEVSSKATNNLIGGTVAGARNIVSGNGIGISISSTGTDGNKIQGNYVGPDQAGTGAPYPSQSGIFVSFGATNTTIGGTASGAGNLISGNSTALFISDSTTTGTVVQGNSIGTNAAGTGALANSSGILIAGGSGTTIGGTASGASNLIAFNADDGINVSGTATATIRGNSISSNAGLGINLEPGGETANTVTPNDVGDADTGPNGLQNYPVVSSVTTSGGTTTIAGTLNSLANTPFTLDFYSSDAADASGFGEGKVYLG
ncbi:MAG: hypothetical protein JOZ57_11940, partial [Abitibacteriaceae bacterium]|nr:hypothetical protein [Abditibacteriaceae bacterium]